MLQELRKCLLPFGNRATVTNLQCDLKSLAAHWEKLKTTALDEHRTKKVRDDDEDAKDPEMENKYCVSCKNCAVCCYQILKRYNLFTDAYHVIGLAYKFVLTLSVTQVACERSFSTLKYIKNDLGTHIPKKT